MNRTIYLLSNLTFNILRIDQNAYIFCYILQKIHIEQCPKISPSYTRRCEAVQLFGMRHEIFHAKQHEEAFGYA